MLLALRSRPTLTMGPGSWLSCPLDARPSAPDGCSRSRGTPMVRLSATKHVLSPRGMLSAQVLTTTRPGRPLQPGLPSKPSSLWALFMTWRFTLSTSPMPTSMVVFLLASLCSWSSLKVLWRQRRPSRCVACRRACMASSRAVGCGMRSWARC